MAGGGWEWQADRQRWVAHAPVERGAAVLVLVFVTMQVVMWLTSDPDSWLIHGWWATLPWAAIMAPLGIAALARLRRMDVTFDGEVVEVRTALVVTRFRRDDVVAAEPESAAASHLLALRVHRPERRLAGVRLPGLRSVSRVTTLAPEWWWAQVVELPPGRTTVGRVRRTWARLRGRPVPRPTFD